MSALRGDSGQSLPVVLVLVTVLFLLGSALAMHASAALRTTAANERQGDELYAADGGAELAIWWQRQAKAGNPPAIVLNGVSSSSTVALSGGTVTVTATAGGSTVTATYPDVGALRPTLQTWTVTK